MYMIGWIYSDPVRIGLATVVRRGDQKKLEATKTLADTSNRFRVVSDIVYDDFMQWETPLGVEPVPSRLAAPPHVLCTTIEQQGVSSVTNLEPGIQSGPFLVAESKVTLFWSQKNIIPPKLNRVFDRKTNPRHF